MRLLSTGLALLLLVSLGVRSVSAAEILDAKVSNGSELSRVEIELEQLPRYQLSFAEGPAGMEVIVLDLEASADPPRRSLSVGRGRVSGLRLVSGEGHTQVRVFLSRPGLAVSELTLADPPRVVLEVP